MNRTLVIVTALLVVAGIAGAVFWQSLQQEDAVLLPAQDEPGLTTDDIQTLLRQYASPVTQAYINAGFPTAQELDVLTESLLVKAYQDGEVHVKEELENPFAPGERLVIVTVHDLPDASDAHCGVYGQPFCYMVYDDGLEPRVVALFDSFDISNEIRKDTDERSNLLRGNIELREFISEDEFIYLAKWGEGGYGYELGHAIRTDDRSKRYVAQVEVDVKENGDLTITVGDEFTEVVLSTVYLQETQKLGPVVVSDQTGELMTLEEGIAIGDSYLYVEYAEAHVKDWILPFEFDGVRYVYDYSNKPAVLR